MNKYRLLMTGICLFIISATTAAQEARWYDAAQLDRGQVVFQQNCASCHGNNAEAKTGWKEASGEASAPPLNGSGHTWHHSLKQMKKTIQQGSIQLGGSMPAFEEKLSDQDIDSVIAYFQSKWPEPTYAGWAEKFMTVASTNTSKSTSTPTTTPTPPGKVDEMTRLLRLRLGINTIPPAVETSVKGVYQTQIGDKFAYLIENGRYVFVGDFIDLERAQNFTENSRRAQVKETLAEIPMSDFIIYPAKGEERTHLNVFTDTSCAYCRKLHAEVGHLQEAGISVRYLPFPRGGNRGPGYQDLKSVWCAEDPLEAMNIAKEVSEGSLGDGNCERAALVDKGFVLGQKLGLTGTPLLYSAKGTKFTGYVPYNKLIPSLLGEL